MATPYLIIEMAAMKLNLELCLAVAISEFCWISDSRRCE